MEWAVLASITLIKGEKGYVANERRLRFHRSPVRLCKSLDEARQDACQLKPDEGIIYTNGFFSEKFKRIIGQGKWFPMREKN